VTGGAFKGKDLRKSRGTFDKGPSARGQGGGGLPRKGERGGKLASAHQGKGKVQFLSMKGRSPGQRSPKKDSRGGGQTEGDAWGTPSLSKGKRG